jgi:hypothetical protein
MAITIINNQPIQFFTEQEIDKSCFCLGREYEQIIGTNDPTQFQVKTSDVVGNGNFSNGLDGWLTAPSLQLQGVSTNETGLGLCDGTITLTASGGTPIYLYSIDGINFVVSNVFTNLCSSNYILYVKDAEDNIASVTIGIGTNVDCSLYLGAEAYDVLSIGAINIKECQASCLAGLGGC